MNQTRQRICLGQPVASTQKVVSIFEPHTDIIVKDRRETLYGHKVFLTTGVSGLVLDLLLPPGNLSDGTFAVSCMQRRKKLYGRPPKQACFDGGFTSHANRTRSINVQNGNLPRAQMNRIMVSPLINFISLWDD